MPKVKQTKDELITHLKENLGFLKASAAAFDAGQTGESKRLAVSIRVLLHDTRHSKSLLGLLGWKEGHSFFDTANNYDPKNILSHHGLVRLSFKDGNSSYSAPLDDASPGRPYKYVKFPDWWNEVVIVDSKKSKFNRRELLLSLADTDGGAHVDPELDQAYADLSRNNSVGWVFSDVNGERPLEGVELHSVRQIAHEVITSIEQQMNKRGIK